MLFPESFIEEIKLKIPISRVVGSKVKLKRYGTSLKGLCPFHNEKTPSFTVHDNKGMYFCFGCQASGDIFKFVSDTQKLNFNEAVKQLANQAGINLPALSPQEKKQELKKTSLIEITEAASNWFARQLHLSENNFAYKYIISRGLEDEDINKFSIGFAPNLGLTAFLNSKGFSNDLIVDAGLAIKTQKDGIIEKFRNRIIFPIKNLKNQTVGFGGRSLDSEVVPKYLNSPETSLFKKKNLLYAGEIAKEACLRKNRVIVVEGYIDAIFMHKAGLDEATASLGTAFNESHINILKSLADEIILCFDGDEAGKKAMFKAAIMALSDLEPGLNFKFCILAGGKDPDEIIQNYGVKYLNSLIESSLSIGDFIWQEEKKFLKNFNPESTALFEHKIYEYVTKIKNPIIAGHFKNYFKTKLWQEFSSSNLNNKKQFKKNVSSLPIVSELPTVKRLEYALFAQIFNKKSLILDKQIFDEIFHMQLKSEELEKLKDVILICHENNEIEENFLKNLLIEKNLVKLIEFLCGKDSSFIDQFANLDDDLAKQIWLLTQKKYVLELHLCDYHNILQKACNDDNIYEKAIALKKLIDDLRIEILNLENNI